MFLGSMYLAFTGFIDVLFGFFGLLFGFCMVMVVWVCWCFYGSVYYIKLFLLVVVFVCFLVFVFSGVFLG